VLAYATKATKKAAWDSGNLAGLFDVLIEASLTKGVPDDALALPRWAVDGAIDYFRKTFRAVKGGKGRKTHWIERYRQDRIDFERYDAVYSFHFNRGLTWDDAYVEASRTLEGLAGGPISTIRDSYKRVAKALKADSYGRYYRSRFLPITHLDKK
jgi:hypothetical protein